MIDLVAAEARLEVAADALEISPPRALLDANGAPSHELLTFCEAKNVSLDWIFLGDVRGMIRSAAAQMPGR